jgi:hypothetical protein
MFDLSLFSKIVGMMVPCRGAMPNLAPLFQEAQRVHQKRDLGHLCRGLV